MDIACPTHRLWLLQEHLRLADLNLVRLEPQRLRHFGEDGLACLFVALRPGAGESFAAQVLVPLVEGVELLPECEARTTDVYVLLHSTRIRNGVQGPLAVVPSGAHRPSPHIP